MCVCVWACCESRVVLLVAVSHGTSWIRSGGDGERHLRRTKENEQENKDPRYLAKAERANLPIWPPVILSLSIYMHRSFIGGSSALEACATTTDDRSRRRSADSTHTTPTLSESKQQTSPSNSSHITPQKDVGDSGGAKATPATEANSSSATAGSSRLAPLKVIEKMLEADDTLSTESFVSKLTPRSTEATVSLNGLRLRNAADAAAAAAVFDNDGHAHISILSHQEQKVLENIKKLCMFNYDDFVNIDDRMTFLGEIGMVSTTTKYSHSKMVVGSAIKIEASEIVKCVKAVLIGMPGMAGILSLLDTVWEKMTLELVGRLASSNHMKLSHVDLAISHGDMMVLALVKINTIETERKWWSLFTSASKRKYKIEYCVYRVQVHRTHLLSTAAMMMALERFTALRSLAIPDRMLAHIKLGQELEDVIKAENQALSPTASPSPSPSPSV